MTKQISRRQILKGGGALVVSFSMFGPLLKAFAQDAPEARPLAAERVDLGTFIPELGDYLDPRDLYSWLVVAADGSVTVHSGKVDIGTGNRTALTRIVAGALRALEPRDAVHRQYRQDGGQGRTVGSSTIPRGISRRLRANRKRLPSCLMGRLPPRMARSKSCLLACQTGAAPPRSSGVLI